MGAVRARHRGHGPHPGSRTRRAASSSSSSMTRPRPPSTRPAPTPSSVASSRAWTSSTPSWRAARRPTSSRTRCASSRGHRRAGAAAARAHARAAVSRRSRPPTRWPPSCPATLAGIELTDRATFSSDVILRPVGSRRRRRAGGPRRSAARPRDARRRPRRRRRARRVRQRRGADLEGVAPQRCVRTCSAGSCWASARMHLDPARHRRPRGHALSDPAGGRPEEQVAYGRSARTSSGSSAPTRAPRGGHRGAAVGASRGSSARPPRRRSWRESGLARPDPSAIQRRPAPALVRPTTTRSLKSPRRGVLEDELVAAVRQHLALDDDEALVRLRRRADARGLGAAPLELDRLPARGSAAER